MALRQTVGGLAATLLSILHTRFELLTLEATEQKSRLLVLMGMAASAMLFFVLAVFVFTAMVAVYFWPTEDRYMALAVLSFIYLAIAVGLVVAIRSRLVNGPPPFAATLDELRRDVDLLNRLKQPTPTPVPPEWMPPGDRS